MTFKAGERVKVICLRCRYKFTVIANWGGGFRLLSNERINPAKCPQCGSLKLEVW